MKHRLSASRELDRFGRVVMEIEAGKPVFYLTPTCAGCGHVGRLRCTSRHLPPEALGQILRNRGWHAGARLTCPHCLARRKGAPYVDPEIIAMPTQFPEMAPAVIAGAATAPTPAAPTPDQRRRVREALFDHYLEDKGCYRQAFSDKSLAAKLDVPWRWVADMREALGMGGDVNEAKSAYDAELDAIRKDLAEIGEAYLARITRAEERLKKLEVDRAYQAA